MIEIQSSKEEKNLFLLIPHHPTKQDGEEFKMGAFPAPSSSPSPQGDKGKGERGRGRELKLS